MRAVLANAPLESWSTIAKIVALVLGMATVGNMALGILLAPTGIVLNRLPEDQLALVATGLFQVAGFAATTLVGLLLFGLPWWGAVLCGLAVALPTIAKPRYAT